MQVADWTGDGVTDFYAMGTPSVLNAFRRSRIHRMSHYLMLPVHVRDGDACAVRAWLAAGVVDEELDRAKDLDREVLCKSGVRSFVP